MITKIVEALKANAPTNMSVVMFGSKPLPSPPYVVVKQENDLAGRGTAYRIIAHYKPGQNIFLEDYIRGTVGDALDGLETTDRNGNFNFIDQDEFGSLPELTINSDDDTISMERVYYKPDKYFL